MQVHALSHWALPQKTADLFQERGLHGKVLGDHIEAEEVAVDASAGHGQAVHVLMLLTRCLKQPELLLRLKDKGQEGHALDILGRTVWIHVSNEG